MVGERGRRRHQDDLFLFPLIDVPDGKIYIILLSGVFPDYKIFKIKIRKIKRRHANSLSCGVGAGGMSRRGRRGSFKKRFLIIKNDVLLSLLF